MWHSAKRKLLIIALCHYAVCNYGECRILFFITLNVVMLSVIMLSVAFYLSLCWMPLCWVYLCWVYLCWVSYFIYHYAECRYAVCHYGECRGANLPICLIASVNLTASIPLNAQRNIIFYPVGHIIEGASNKVSILPFCLDNRDVSLSEKCDCHYKSVLKLNSKI
jgi:hypothetical protein